MITWRGLGWEDLIQAMVITSLLVVGALLLIGEKMESIAAQRRKRRSDENQ